MYIGGQRFACPFSPKIGGEGGRRPDEEPVFGVQCSVTNGFPLTPTLSPRGTVVKWENRLRGERGQSQSALPSFLIT